MISNRKTLISIALFGILNTAGAASAQDAAQQQFVSFLTAMPTVTTIKNGPAAIAIITATPADVPPDTTKRPPVKRPPI